LRRNSFSKRNLLLWRARSRRPNKGGARAACVCGAGHRSLRLRLAVAPGDNGGGDAAVAV
jgi:hypothetical protein